MLLASIYSYCDDNKCPVSRGGRTRRFCLEYDTRTISQSVARDRHQHEPRRSIKSGVGCVFSANSWSKSVKSRHGARRDFAFRPAIKRKRHNEERWMGESGSDSGRRASLRFIAYLHISTESPRRFIKFNVFTRIDARRIADTLYP